MIDQRKIQRTLDRLGYRRFDAFRIEHFVQHVQNFRQRTILCVPHAFSPGVSGFWLQGKLIDFIFYRSNTHAIHQTHIILHEIAHMLLDHPLRPITADLPAELLQELSTPVGHLRAVEVNRIRDVYEQEAEYFVELVQKQVVNAERLAELTADGTSIPALEPYVSGLAFGERRVTGE